jgi:hypothetical protein
MPDKIVFDKIKKSAVSEVWVTLEEYQGQRLVHVREYFHPADNPEWLPTKKGVAFPPELLGEAVDATEALAKMDTVGVVAELERGNRARLRFAICEFNKHIYGELRTYYVDDANSKDWKPGKGVTLPLAVIGRLAEALHMAEDHLDG